MASYTAQQAEAALKPQFDALTKELENENWSVVEGYYHPNGVLIHKDKESVYGNKAITAHTAKFAEATGKSKFSTINPKYEGAGDYLIITADFTTETEKAGTFKGKFLQIWKKEGDRHLVYHDEFEIIA